MSSNRFAAVVIVLAAAALVGAFALSSTLLDDGSEAAPSSPTAGTVPGSEAPAATAPPPAPGSAPAVASELATPAWVVVVSSERERDRAEDIARTVSEVGQPAGVLRSGDHASLSPGFWVAYAGPVADPAQGEAVAAALAEDGIGGAYVRCVGTVDQCGPSPD